LLSLAAMSFALRPRRRETMSPSRLARVRTPMPPTSRPIRIATVPNVDQWVDMSTVLSPVTQIEDIAVKNASASGVTLRSALAIGRERTAVRARTSPVKIRMANLAGEDAAKKSTKSRTRANTDPWAMALARILPP
jgi:hypothetical protein